MLGWEPREFHRYYDAEGNPCAAAEAYSTVVTRETEWDDEQVGRMLALQLHDSKRCSCGCGLPVAVAHDKALPFVTDQVICQARKWLDVAQRDFEQKQLPPDKRDPKWVEGRPRPGDGVLWTVAPLQQEKSETPEVHDG